MSMSAAAENPAAAPSAQPAQQAAQQQHVQQQPQQPQPHQVAAQAAAQPQQPPTPSDTDSLVCRWASCGERQSTAENLYNHVCDRHVGRKSTNNLNLTCQWGSCRTQTLKRDHITSHVRVHVPLKPHKCQTCNKAFKRPQDLKKHVKTHADDSVLLRSPEPNRGHPHGGPGGFATGGKNVTDLQALAGAASGFYQDGMGGTSYGHPNAGAGGAFYSGAPANSAYGPVYYAVNPQQQMTNDYEVRKRAVDALNALNDFFGSVKRREIDPTTYYDVGHRLMGIQGQIPLLTSMAGYGNSDFQSQPAMVSPTGHGSAPAHNHYSLPIPNLRTKSDLVEIDQVLEQLQNTVYENPKQAAAAGVGQPGAHYLHSGFNYRSSNSPPVTHGIQPQSSHATTLAPLSTSQTETPALTPASSIVSYTSGQSPSSVHSGHTVSPALRNNNISMYPTLPSVSAMSDIAGSYPATSNAPNLAPFDSDSRRRWSGNQLQKARPARDSEAMDISDDDSTPNASRRNSVDRDGLRKDVHKLAIQSPPPVDPSLRSPGEQSEDSEHHSSDQGASDQGASDGDECWVQNMRMIEELRAFIKAKLERGEFEDGDAPLPPSEIKDEQPAEEKASSSAMSDDERSLYPVLRAVQDGE